MKIAYLLPGGLFNSGGMERVTIIKANYLAEKMGCDVSIITTEQMGRPVFFSLSDKIHLHHLNINIYGSFGHESYIRKCTSRFFKIRKYKKALSKLLCDLRPDVTISTLGIDIEFINDLKDGSIKIGELHFPGNFRYLMALKMYKSYLPILVEKIRTKTLQKRCAQLDRLVVLTNEEKLFWEKASNIEIIPNPLSLIPEQASECKAKKAIAVGRLVYEKGFDQLIEAWKMIHEKYPDWELSIFGNGDQKDKLQALITQYGLDAVIQICDPVKDINAQFQKHSIMIFPSRCLDALPMVLLEAMSCGLPIVSFDAPCGPKDILADGKNGFLVKEGNIAALSEKVCSLMESESLRISMGQAGREMSFNYLEDKIMNRWTGLFQRLIENRTYNNVIL